MYTHDQQLKAEMAACRVAIAQLKSRCRHASPEEICNTGEEIEKLRIKCSALFAARRKMHERHYEDTLRVPS